jgi:hypothetical protein
MKISSPKAINWTLKQYGYTYVHTRFPCTLATMLCTFAFLPLSFRVTVNNAATCGVNSCTRVLIIAVMRRAHPISSSSHAPHPFPKKLKAIQCYQMDLLQTPIFARKRQDISNFNWKWIIFQNHKNRNLTTTFSLKLALQFPILLNPRFLYDF